MSLLAQLRDYELRKRAEGQKAATDGEDASTSGEMPFMYALQNVRYEVRLRADGSVRDVVTLSNGKTKGKDSGKPMAAPNLVRTVGIKPRLMMDNAEYALGQAKKEGDKNTARRHEAFKSLVAVCAEATRQPAVETVSRFLTGLDPHAFRQQHLPADFTPDMNVMFSVDDVNPLDLMEVRQFWAAQFGPAENNAEATGFTAECLITGSVGPVMEREPVKIKGILGGQTSGMNFISANAQAFESYGLEASQIAPVKFEAAEQYANGLNRLLSDPTTSMKTSGMTYAFWTKKGATLPVAQMLTNPDDLDFGISDEPAEVLAQSEQVSATLRSPFKGLPPNLDPHSAFYAVGMTPSGSRIAVRTHLTSTVQDAVDNLARYFAAQTLVPINPVGSKNPDRETYDIRTLVSGMYRDISKEHTAPDVDALVQFALTGQALPRSFLPKLAARNRADEYRVTRPRAVLSKMVLLSGNYKELNMDKDTLDALNPDQPEPAYHLGRLLAVLDDIQSSVMKANTTLVDRFYGSMSTTPYAVTGRLIQGTQAHLQKLRKENEGAYFSKQRELEGVLSHLNVKDFQRKPLTTPQQAMFALGYYHQRAHISAEIRQRSEDKKAKAEAAKQPTLLTPEGAEQA